VPRRRRRLGKQDETLDLTAFKSYETIGYGLDKAVNHTFSTKPLTQAAAAIKLMEMEPSHNSQWEAMERTECNSV
jgi:hypothetical protein